MLTGNEVQEGLPKRIVTPRLTIRKGLRKDIPKIYQLLDAHALAMLRHWHDFSLETTAHSYKFLRDLQITKAAYTILHDSEVIGFRWFEPSFRYYLYEGNWLTTGSWFGPNGRGQGFAREALTAFVEAVRQSRFDGIETGTREDNIRTQKLFRDCGFNLGRPRKSWDGPTMVDLDIDVRVKVS